MYLSIRIWLICCSQSLWTWRPEICVEIELNCMDKLYVLWSIDLIDSKKKVSRLGKTTVYFFFFFRLRFFVFFRYTNPSLSLWWKVHNSESSFFLCFIESTFLWLTLLPFGCYWRHWHQTLSARIDFSIKFTFFVCVYARSWFHRLFYIFSRIFPGKILRIVVMCLAFFSRHVGVNA